jgi:hypothetical protein
VAFLRRRWRWAGAWIGLSVLIQLSAFLLPGQAIFRSYLAGAVGASSIAVLWFWAVQETNTASIMRGDIAERQTASELRRLRRRGWLLINHFMRERRDIDHVAIGPGLVLVVSTKWSSVPWNLDVPEQRVALVAEQVAGDAQLIRSLMGRDRVTTIPVLMLWGSASPSGPARRHEPSGTVVVCGQHALRQWLAGLPSTTDPGQAEKIWAGLAEQVRRRDTREPEPARTGELILARALLQGCTAVAVFMTVAAAATITDNAWVTAAAALVATFVGALGARRPSTRPWALGWLVGAGSAAGVVIGAIASSIFR